MQAYCDRQSVDMNAIAFLFVLPPASPQHNHKRYAPL